MQNLKNSEELSTVPPLTISLEKDGRQILQRSFLKSFLIGRDPECEVYIDDPAVSRMHAKVVFEDQKWHIQDLGSSNGTIINGKKIDHFNLGRDTRLRLGSLGVWLRVTIPDIPDQEKTVIAPASLADYQKHYFDSSDDAEAGEHTLMMRKAFSQVQLKQKKKYYLVIISVVLLLLVTGAYAVYQHLAIRKQKALAENIFYNMKALDVEFARVMTRTMATGNIGDQKKIAQFRNQRRQMEQSYNQFVDTLKVYGKGISDKERIILKIARIFGECEINMPAGFVEEVLNYISKWRATGRLERAIRRARVNGYTPKVIETMETYGLAPQFFYLALQESNYNVNACGPKTRFGIAKGAWQFIPSTAAQYGLRPGPLVDLPEPDDKDERHHFGRSTLAAARYIKDIYSTEAQASGLLVIASYNWGERRVNELIRSLPENPRERNFWNVLTNYKDQIPKETYDYVFYIFSAAVIGENPRLFGFNFDNPLRLAKK